jgi:L-lysine exporter family protein LysE/ArgO
MVATSQITDRQPWHLDRGRRAGEMGYLPGLGFGARLLSPLMARPLTWRILDSAIGVVMLLIAVALVRSAVG